MTTSTYLNELRNDLLAGIQNDRGRRRTRARLVAGAAVAIGVVVAPLSITMSHDGTVNVSDALAIASTAHGSFDVAIADASADPDDMERQLADFGIDAEIEAVPVSPSLQGKLVGFESRADPGGLAPDEFVDSIELTTDSSYWLAVGRAPSSADETLVVAKNPESRGEPLHCIVAPGMTAQSAHDAITALGYEVTWRTETFDRSGNGAQGMSLEAEPAPEVATTGFAWISEGTIAVFADPSAAVTVGGDIC